MSDYQIPKYRYGWLVMGWLWLGLTAYTGMTGPIFEGSVSSHFMHNLLLAAFFWYPVNYAVKYVYYAYHNHLQDKAAASKRSRLP